MQMPFFFLNSTGFLVAIAYLDHGNLEGDLQARHIYVPSLLRLSLFIFRELFRTLFAFVGAFVISKENSVLILSNNALIMDTRRWVRPDFPETLSQVMSS